MKNKDTIFSKNNYDSQLEETLESKSFDDEAKSLILNTLYKIENGYKDYSKIKYDVKPKNDIISELNNIIKYDCNDIEIVDPNETRNKFAVDRKNKKIKAFPNEVYLLQALYYIHTPDAQRIENVFDKSMRVVLNKGMSINSVEIIRDFNGWSWNNSIDNKNSKYYNLIYQDLLILLGEKKLSELVKQNDLKTELKSGLEELYGEKKASSFLEKIEKCCLLIYANLNKSNEKELMDYLKEKQTELCEISNKEEYISNLMDENDKNRQAVKKIDNVLMNEKLLRKKFLNPKIKAKYKTVQNYKRYLENYRSNKLKVLVENSNAIAPFEYAKLRKKIEKEIQILNDIFILIRRNDSVFYNLIDLQRKTISCFYKKIEVHDLKKELINLIYEVRYYNLLPIDNTRKIKDLKELEVDRRNMQKKLITKLCDNKVIDQITKDYNVNYKILKYIFVAKMTNINKIQIKLKYIDRKLIIEYYDENILESKESINFSDDDYNELIKRVDRKMRIFI